MGLQQGIPLLTVRIGRHLHPHQGRLPQVQSLPLRLHALLELLEGRPLGLQDNFLNRQARLAIDHLHQLAATAPTTPPYAECRDD